MSKVDAIWQEDEQRCIYSGVFYWTDLQHLPNIVIVVSQQIQCTYRNGYTKGMEIGFAGADCPHREPCPSGDGRAAQETDPIAGVVEGTGV